MKRLVASITLALGLLVAPAAHADNAITAARAELTDDAFVLHVAAARPIGAPRVRTEPGYVRVWLPDVGTDAIDPPTDGAVVRSVRVRPGFGETAVVVVRLGDQRDVGARAVDVAREGSAVTIRIARSSLPSAVAAPTNAPATEQPAETAEAEAEPSNGALEATGEAASEAATTAGEDEGTPSTPLALARRPADPLPASSSIPLAALLVIAAVLGGAYLLVRTFANKRKGAGPARDIEIVATKRIGARHQILVVRALGRDYLLSVHGGRTEKLASLPASVEPTSSETGGEFAPFLRLASSGGSDSEGTRSGSELLRAAMTQRTDAVELARSAPSEAVAGLLRLRQRAGRG